MSRKQRIIVSITGIILVSLILIGLTYAYFLTKIKGNSNTKSISVTTANLLLEYADINDELISDSKVEPGKSWTKTFVATNKGNKTVTYGVALENVVNQLERKEDLVYTLECKQYLKSGLNIDTTNKTVTGTISGTCNGVSAETTFPSIGTILVQNDIADDKAQVYTLTITYKETNTDQSVDMNKTFSAKANIVDPNTFSPYGEGTLASAIYKSAETATTNSDTTRTTMGTTVTEFTSLSGENEHVLNNAPDDYGTSYYFRGNVKDNYVTFADKKWRIVRINGDGTVRLILDDVAKDSSGTVIKTSFNPSSNDNAYVGYMYGMTGQTSSNTNQCIKLNSAGTVAEVDTTNTTESACTSAGYKWTTTPYDATHVNVVESTVKKSLDTWYENNIKTNYSDYIADTLFCNDKTLASNGIGGVSTQYGYGTNKTFYASNARLQYSSGTTSITTVKPTFKCAESATNTYSRYTVDVATLANGNKTNGDLTYPIGLLSADEVSFAGAYKYNQTNKTYYLYNSSITSSWWLSSPFSYNGSNAYGWYVSYSIGSIYSIYVSNSIAFRPSVNLKADVMIDSGDGTSSNPYTLKLQ